MGFRFYIICALSVFVFTQSSFAYDSLVKHYDDRQDAYGRGENVDIHTTGINDVLSKENLINPNLHDPLKNKKVIQAVMASVIIHREDHKLSSRLPRPVTNRALLKHFEILKLTENISLGIIKDGYNPGDLDLLEEYSGITEPTFFAWFSDVQKHHRNKIKTMAQNRTSDAMHLVQSSPYVKSAIAPSPVHTPPSRSLEEFPPFDSPFVKDEYKQLGIPFTLAVTQQETEDAPMVLPGLNRRQQELGFNGWGLGSADAGDFHQHAQKWSDQEYNQYFEQGILREIVFLLTGVKKTDGHKVNSESHYNDPEKAQARIILSLYKEMTLTENRSHPLVNSVIKNIKSKNSIYKEDATGKIDCYYFYLLNKPESPVAYEEYKFNLKTQKDMNDMYLLALCVEHVVIETMKTLKTDPAVLSLAKKFHKQKLIEERIRENQRGRLDGTNTDGRWEAVGPALDRENKLTDIANRTLFWLIEAKIRHVMDDN